MTCRFRLVTYGLVGLLSLSAVANGAERVASQADLDAAIVKALGDEDAARRTITTLLERDDVRRMAAGYRVDLRRAEAAVGTLQGDELDRVSRLAATADGRLAGGDAGEALLGGALGAAAVVVLLLALASWTD